MSIRSTISSATRSLHQAGCDAARIKRDRRSCGILGTSRISDLSWVRKSALVVHSVRNFLALAEN